MKQIKGTNKT